MLSEQTLDEYRRMTPAERLALTLELTGENEPYLYAGDPQIVARRLQRLTEESALYNERILRGIARSEGRE